jgi:Leucine-rich repeat (LRR) protein
MGLTEVPSELFRMKNLKELYLNNNFLCSLPSEIAHLPTLEGLYVRLLKGLDRDLTDLTKSMLFQVPGNQLTSLPPKLGLLTNIKGLYVRHSRLINLDLTRVTCFRSATTSSRRCQLKSAICHSSSGSQYETRIEWIVI